MNWDFPKKINSNKVPNFVKLVYEDDLDIVKVHEYVKNWFYDKKKSLWEEYRELVEPLLTEYIPLSSNEIKGILSMKEEKRINVRRRLYLIEMYIEVLKKYINVDAYCKIDKKFRCKCGRGKNEEYMKSNGTKYECLCGYSYYFMSKDISYNDCYKTQSVLNSYEDKANFIKAIDRYCVKQKTKKIPNNLFDLLDDHFINIGMKPGEYYRSLKVKKNKFKECVGNKNGTNCIMLFEALKETGNSSCYDDIIMIGHLYWNWTPPNLDEHLNIIKEIYDITQTVYENIPNKSRQSSLNVNTRLFFTLEFLNIPCHREDFKLLDSKESNNEHIEMWNLMISDISVVNIYKEYMKNKNLVDH